MIFSNELVQISPIFVMKATDIKEKTFLFKSAYKDKNGKVRVHLVPYPKVGNLDFYYIVLDRLEDVETILIPTGEFVE